MAATGEGLVQFENKVPWKYHVYQRNEGLTNTFIWLSQKIKMRISGLVPTKE